MRRTHLAPIPLVTIAIALAACAGQVAAPESSAEESDRPSRTAPELATIPPSDSPVTGEVPSAIMADLVADASERTDEEPDAIEVVQAAAVTWSDGSLDCPEPGMLYTQALVDGYHVILRGGDEELDYRVTAQGGFRLCEGGGRPSG